MSDALRPHELQHARLPFPSPTPKVHPNSCPSSWWCHPTILSSVISFSSRPQSFPASGSFPMSQLFASGGQSIGVSASTSVLPVNTQRHRPPNAMCLSLRYVTLFSASSGPCFCFQLPFDYENLENWDSTSFWVLSLSRARHSGTLQITFSRTIKQQLVCILGFFSDYRYLQVECFRALEFCRCGKEVWASGKSTGYHIPSTHICLEKLHFCLFFFTLGFLCK